MGFTPGSYVIWRTYGAGFWSIIGTTLSHIRIAHDRGLVPVVDFENFKTIYNEIEPVHETNNMWEYYFEQPGGRSIHQVETEAFVCDGRIPKGFPRDLTDPFFKFQWDSKINLKPRIMGRIQSTLGDLALSSRTLGVHLRGQDARRAKGHMFPGTMRQFCDAIHFALSEADFSEILLVSEAQQYVDYVEKEFGSRITVKVSPTFRLRFRDAYRLKTHPRKNHMYELGFEALQDAYLLAECGGIVRGHSGISDAASMIRDRPFDPFIKIVQGRNSLRPYISPWLWYAKAISPTIFGGFAKWRHST